MVKFYNYIVLPSGKKCNLKEIKNDEFLVLLKYIQGKDYGGFFGALNEMIMETVPDFMTLDVVEKASLYLAMCYYSVHNSIMIGNKIFGTTEINLSIILNAIEESYNDLPRAFKYELKDNLEVVIGLPKTFDADHTGITLNYISGIKKIRNNSIESIEDIQKVSTELPTKLAFKIEQVVRKHYSAKCNLYEDLTVNLCNEELPYMIFQMYSEKLEDFYEIMYYVFEYLKWDYNTFSQFTPLETRAMFALYKEDKEKQAAEREKQMAGH